MRLTIERLRSPAQALDVTRSGRRNTVHDMGLATARHGTAWDPYPYFHRIVSDSCRSRALAACCRGPQSGKQPRCSALSIHVSGIFQP
jgi:hypothetical protein